MDKPVSLEHFKKTKRMQNIFRKLYGSSGDYDPIKEAHELEESDKKMLEEHGPYNPDDDFEEEYWEALDQEQESL